MVTRAEIIAEAREWIGTKWQHQQRTKGLATDCGGMIYGVGFALGLLPPVAQLRGAHRFAGYSRLARNGSLVEACALILQPIELSAMQPGDAVLMKFQSEPQHVGLLGDYPNGGLSLIHAYAPLKKVVEHRLDSSWMAKTVMAFRYPGVE